MWVGSRRESWQDVSEVLERFGRRKREAVARYRECVIAGWNQGRREDLTGGGLLRSAGGPEEVARRRPEERESADERILGRAVSSSRTSGALLAPLASQGPNDHDTGRRFSKKS